MKKYITIVFLFFSVITFAQEGDIKVNENELKIGELNERLDRLINGSKQISGDSISIKIDRLIFDIKEIKSEMNVLRNTVQKLDNESKSGRRLNEFDSKLDEIENGKYYVVIGSEREQKRAIRILKNIQKTQEAVLVQNDRKSWYHIVLASPLSMKQAIKEKSKQQQLGFADAWWINAKKLVIVD